MKYYIVKVSNKMFVSSEVSEFGSCHLDDDRARATVFSETTIAWVAKRLRDTGLNVELEEVNVVLLADWLRMVYKDRNQSRSNTKVDIINVDTGEVFFTGKIHYLQTGLINPSLIFVGTTGEDHTIWFKESE